jgi:site-specific DNA recombinase
VDIDVLITHIYEDMALGNLSRERYQKMAENCEAEQARLNNKTISLEDWVATREEIDDSFGRFTALVEKYVDIPELTPTIVNEIIKKIIVYALEKQGSRRIQKVRIIFNFLDELDMLGLGEPVVTETTYGRRKTA